MNKPPPDVIQKSMDIRCRSKRGLPISDDDHEWNIRVYDKYSEWYKHTEPHVWNRTLPFGSNVYKDEEEGLL